MALRFLFLVLFDGDCVLQGHEDGESEDGEVSLLPLPIVCEMIFPLAVEEIFVKL